MEIDFETVERTDDGFEGGVGCGALEGGVGGGDDLEGNDLVEGVRDRDDFNSITPKIGMEFPTSEDAYKFYNRYALKMRFGSRKGTTMKSRSEDLVISRKFVCSKEGKRRPLKKKIVEDDEQHRREIRVECKAMMKIILTSSGSWRVSVFVSKHNNHELSTPSKAQKHRSHKGRPRVPSRLKSRLEVSQEESTKKQKTCGFCGEKGHYRTGCSKAKANEVACRKQFVAGVSQAE